MRGVERPDDVRLDPGVPRSGTLRVELPESEVAIAGGRCLRDDCLGGEGARVEVECEPLVYRRDMLVVKDDVPVTGSTGGERGVNEGALVTGRPFPLASDDDEGIAGCSSRILRRDSTVRNGWGLESDAEESDCEGNSSIGVIVGGIKRWCWCDESDGALRLDAREDRDCERGRCCWCCRYVGVSECDIRLQKKIETIGKSACLLRDRQR